MRLIDGIKNTLIIDDTYNSSPVACEEAVVTLGDIKTTKKKIAILADMMEIGKFSAEAHKDVGTLVAKSADVLITVGMRARFFAEGALNNGMDENNIFQYDDSVSAGKFAESLINSGDIILIKGSQSTRMEKAVGELMAHPEDAGKLLVRQEEEWRVR
jgi:UDP-N-acetylmuramoyl-tripeptide--D-alanyl-D-alanine ligase